MWKCLLSVRELSVRESSVVRAQGRKLSRRVR